VLWPPEARVWCSTSKPNIVGSLVQLWKEPSGIVVGVCLRVSTHTVHNVKPMLVVKE
jgi:hypothetical protein